MLTNIIVFLFSYTYFFLKYKITENDRRIVVQSVVLFKIQEYKGLATAVSVIISRVEASFFKTDVEWLEDIETLVNFIVNAKNYARPKNFQNHGTGYPRNQFIGIHPTMQMNVLSGLKYSNK